MNSQNNFRDNIEKAEKIRKVARLKLRVNLVYFFVVYGAGIPLATNVWDSNRTIFYVLVIYMMLNIFLQLYIYISVSGGYSEFVKQNLIGELVAMKFPQVSFEPDAQEVENLINNSSLFFGRPPKGIEVESRFHGDVNGLKFDLSKFNHPPEYLLGGTYANIINPVTVEHMVYLVQRSTKLLTGLGESLKSLPGVKAMLPSIPEQEGVIPELEEAYHIYSESPDSIKSALTSHRTSALLQLAEDRSKLIVVSFSFIDNQINYYDGDRESHYELPSIKHKLTESSPDVVFKGLIEKIEFLKKLV